ncbi:MAG: hypothetical protein DYH05_05390 [Acidobacteria bacterium ACB1]|nr:hypothetical protein [Acidobacteria bacterium ACB1]RIJ91238.1 MAG: hypothetical protein DCC44_09660 [Acidobacteriota bacterium]
MPIAVTKKRKRKSEEMPIFDSIRKPTAPPARRFGDDLPDSVRLPSLRKEKHKKREEERGNE